jgi:hypothetical protein
MSNEIEHFLETQDDAISQGFVDRHSDALTDMLVAALEDAFAILSDEIRAPTVH